MKPVASDFLWNSRKVQPSPFPPNLERSCDSAAFCEFRCQMFRIVVHAVYSQPIFFEPSDRASRTTAATVLAEMPRNLQYFEESHASRVLAPLLALQPMQQSAMLARVMMRASLMMCSQLARLERGPSRDANGARQYTQHVSRDLTSRSSQSGMFQRFTSVHSNSNSDNG